MSKAAITKKDSLFLRVNLLLVMTCIAWSLVLSLSCSVSIQQLKIPERTKQFGWEIKSVQPEPMKKEESKR